MICIKCVISTCNKKCLAHTSFVCSACFNDVLNIKLAVFKDRKNCHPKISSHSDLKLSQSLSIDWPTTHLCFSTNQRLIHSNKRKFTYLSPIGQLPMFTLNDAILEFLPYKLPISKFLPVLSSLFLCPLTHPLSIPYQPNYTLFQKDKQQSHNISPEINCAIILYICDIFISTII